MRQLGKRARGPEEQQVPLIVNKKGICIVMVHRTSIVLEIHVVDVHCFLPTGLRSLTAIGVTECKALTKNAFFNVMVMAHGTYMLLHSAHHCRLAVHTQGFSRANESSIAGMRAQV